MKFSMFYEYTFLVSRVLLANVCAIARDLFLVFTFVLSFGLYPSEPMWSLVIYFGINKQWIEKQMKKNSSIPHHAKVQGIRISKNANRGQSASVHIQLEVTVVLVDGSKTTQKFILKRNERTFVGRFMNLMRTEYREAYVYQENIISRNPEIRTPHVLFTRYSPFYLEHDVVMEDMRDLNGFFGPDLLGALCHKPLYSKNDQRIFLECLARLLANFHSRYWNASKEDKDGDVLLKNSTLCWSNWYAMIQGVETVPRSTLQSQYTFSINFVKNNWKKTKMFIEENKRFWEGKKCDTPYHPHISANKRVGNFPLNISPRVISFIEESLQHSTPSAFLQSLSSRPFTLSHGDFHADNMYVFPSASNSVSNITNNDIIHFDFSDVGFHTPEFDLSNIFFINVVNNPEYSPSEVVDLIQSTLRVYYNVVLQHKVSDENYTFEQCYEGFVLSALQRYCWLFPAIVSVDRLYLTQYFNDGILFYLTHLFKSEDKFIPLKPMIRC